MLANCLICYQIEYATSRAMITQSKNSCCMWGCQSWALRFTSVESKLPSRWNTREWSTTGEVKQPHLKSFQSTPLLPLLEFELDEAEFNPRKSKAWSSGSPGSFINRSRHLKTHFSYLSSPKITVKKKKKPNSFLPRLRSIKETFHFIMLSKSLICPCNCQSDGAAR